MARHIEMERKYDAGADVALPDLRQVAGCAVVGPPETHTLRASYYDTEDLRLASRGITLRRREGGGDEGWHLKLPVAAHTKQEVRVPLDAGARDVPADLATLVAAHVRGGALVRVAELETHRTERELLAEDGRVLAELADDTVSARRLSRDGHEVGLMRWREIEVEAVNGSGELLESIGGHLRASGARESTVGSKLERALDDDLVLARRHTATRTAGDVLMTYLGEQYEQLLEYDPLVRLADHDDDSVHKMRVAVRRTRSILRTHRRLLDQARIRTLDTELKWLADALGEVRDLEVQKDRFEGRLADLPGAHQAPAWLLGMAAEEHRARDRVRETLLTRRYYDLLDTLETLLATPPLNARARRKARKETPELVARAWRKMLRRYDRAAGLPPARTATSRCTARASRPSGPATRPRPPPPRWARRPPSWPGAPNGSRTSSARTTTASSRCSGWPRPPTARTPRPRTPSWPGGSARSNGARASVRWSACRPPRRRPVSASRCAR